LQHSLGAIDNVCDRATLQIQNSNVTMIIALCSHKIWLNHTQNGEDSLNSLDRLLVRPRPANYHLLHFA